VLATALDKATGQFLDNNKSPSRKVGGIDNRGSHFYLATYWAQALAAQTEDTVLQAKFTELAKTLTDNEATIVAELNSVQGKPLDIGGYYFATPELASQAMRPSKTLNDAINALK
jgi:isocitrate dehydrogenase